jgi:protein-disulfide isomerase/uncharacterized membrane protein/rhodanese-related sulfurtransferase
MRKLLIFALSLLGLFDSTYLFWAYTSPSHRMVCGIGSGCDAVRASVFAHIWGVPLPAYGLAMYAALALLVFVEPWLGRLSRSLLTFISGAGFLASLYLTGLEAFVIHAWCAWCVVSALTVTAIFVLALSDRRSPVRPAVNADAVGMATSGRGRRLTYGMLAILAAGLVAGIPAFRYLSHRGNAAPAPPASQEALAEHLVRPDSHAAGDPRASVTVVEFADFVCPACKGAQPTAAAMRKKYGDRVRFVFRQFPLQAIHPQAEKAAEASECAAAQGKFWEMQDKLFAEGDLSEPSLVKYAVALGLDKDRFTSCLSSGAMTGRVQRDVADAHALGFRGTPTFVIGKRTFFGPLQVGEFAQAIDQELAAHGTVTGQAGTYAAKRTPAEPSPLKPSPEPPPLSASGSSNRAGRDGDMLGSSTNPFAQLGGVAPACSEDEARKKQPTLVRTEEARQLFERTPQALFVDVRPSAEFADGHIRGAVNLPIEQVPQRWTSMPKDKTIVFYEGGKGSGDNICAAGRAAGRVLLEHGFGYEQVKVYQDGLLGWEKARLPVVR